MLVAVRGSAPLGEKQSLHEKDSKSDSSDQQVNHTKDKQEENDPVLKKTILSLEVRKEEVEVDLLPGERLSVVVSCQAK